MKTAIATINTDETNDIRYICRKKKELERLSSLIQSSDEALLARYASDLQKCENEYNVWWLNISQKYRLKEMPGCKWQIDFQTNIVYLLEI